MSSDFNSDKPSILIVDDDITTVKFIAQALKDEYELVFALSAEECLSKLKDKKQKSIALILLDVKMPGVDGFTLCDQLKHDKDTQHTPVVFITSAKLEADQEKGFAMGAIDYIIKPINVKILKARLKAHIKQSSDIKHLEALALTDTLTRIPNRRKFNEALESDWKLALRNNSPISLLMIDIDEFKRFNDFYGHPEGDKCLIAVAAALRDTIERPIDMVARIGGEEFAVILPDTDSAGAKKVADKIKAAIHKLNIPHSESRVCEHVTLSIGSSSICPESEEGYEVLISAADKALYKAKHDGKDCYRVAETAS